MFPVIFYYTCRFHRRRGGHQHGQDTRARSGRRRRTADDQVDTEGRRSRGGPVRGRRQPDLRARTSARRQLAITRKQDAQPVWAALRHCRQIVFRPETSKTIDG